MRAYTTRALTKIIFLKVESINRLCNHNQISTPVCLCGTQQKQKKIKKKKKVMSVCKGKATPRKLNLNNFVSTILLEEILEQNVQFHVTLVILYCFWEIWVQLWYLLCTKKEKLYLFFSSRSLWVIWLFFFSNYFVDIWGPASGIRNDK